MRRLLQSEMGIKSTSLSMEEEVILLLCSLSKTKTPQTLPRIMPRDQGTHSDNFSALTPKKKSDLWFSCITYISNTAPTGSAV